MIHTSPHRQRHAKRRSVTRAVLAFALAGATAAAGTVAFSGPASAQTSLAGAAAAQGKYFGTAVAANHLGEQDYAATLNAEFNSVTAENEMKWDALQPTQGTFNFGNADRIAQHAASQGMQLRGHTLVWHSQLPGWVQGLSGDALHSAMQTHIDEVMGHYRGQIVAWDVVNEAFEENGSRRQSVFQQQLGDGYIAEAFRLADAADPDAKLCYNDYNIESVNAKSDAVYDLVSTLLADGVPIDCVGFQSHFNSGNPMPGNFHENLQRFADLGVDVQITELDIAGSGSSQAEQYRGVVQACLAVARCEGITVWGVTDKYSWRSEDTPLLFDGNYQKKEAYDAVIAAFTEGLAGGGETAAAALAPHAAGTNRAARHGRTAS